MGLMGDGDDFPCLDLYWWAVLVAVVDGMPPSRFGDTGFGAADIPMQDALVALVCWFLPPSSYCLAKRARRVRKADRLGSRHTFIDPRIGLDCADVAPTTAVAVRGTHSFTRSGEAAVRPG